MIICLYDTGYPADPRTQPTWENLPYGFFECDRDKLEKIKQQKTLKIDGKFICGENPDGEGPRLGEHYFAAFCYDNTHYLYRATIQYPEITKIDSRSFEWESGLALTELLNVW